MSGLFEFPDEISQVEMRRFGLTVISCALPPRDQSTDATVVVEGEPWPAGWPVYEVSNRGIRFLTSFESGTGAIYFANGAVRWISWDDDGCMEAAPEARLGYVRSPERRDQTVAACGEIIPLNSRGYAWTILPLQSQCFAPGEGALAISHDALVEVPDLAGLSEAEYRAGMDLSKCISSPFPVGDRVRRQEGRAFLRARDDLFDLRESEWFSSATELQRQTE